MNHKYKIIYSIIAMLFVIPIVVQAEIPPTNPIVLNERVTALEERIDTIPKSLILVDANGVVVGLAVDIEGRIVTVVSESVYDMSIGRVHGRVREPGYLYYSDSNCQDMPVTRNMLPGKVLAFNNVNYYLPRDAVELVDFVARSKKSNTGECITSELPDEGPFYYALPNDPAVTGFQNGPYTPPLMLHFR